jgi:tripartite-type tricarboxylate transporter receptor subunit TctC
MLNHTRRLIVTGVTALATSMVFALPSYAQDAFPSQPIRVIVPFPAGGTTDVVARVFAEHMQEDLGQPVVVENRAGGGGSVGADVVARADPDGHTLLFHNITFSATTTVMTHEGRELHSIEDDFEPVSIAVNVPILLLAHPSLEVSNLEEFVAVARERTEAGDPIFYGSTGPGSTMNLVGEVIKAQAEIEMDHIPFPGAAPMVQDLLAGRVLFGGDQLSTSLEHARSGRLTGLAVMAGERSPALPDVPTVGEMGFESRNLRGFNGFIAPAGTPREVIDRIQQSVASAAADPAVIARMEAMGAEASGSTPEEFREVLTEQVAQMRPLVEELGIGSGQ